MGCNPRPGWRMSQDKSLSPPTSRRGSKTADRHDDVCRTRRSSYYYRVAAGNLVARVNRLCHTAATSELSADHADGRRYGQGKCFVCGRILFIRSVHNHRFFRSICVKLRVLRAKTPFNRGVRTAVTCPSPRCAALTEKLPGFSPIYAARCCAMPGFCMFPDPPHL